MRMFDLLSIMLSIVIVVAVFISLSSMGIIQIEGLTQKTEIEINSKESFEKGELAVFKVKAKNPMGIKKIIYVSPNKKEEKKCNSKECNAEFNEIFQKKGILLIEIKVLLENDKKETKKKRIQVTEKGNKCIDGTLFGECSTKKPKYCSNGKLEDNCELCGCEKGKCIEKKCLYTGILEIEKIWTEQKFFKPGQRIDLTVKAKENPKGEFSFEIEWERKGKTEKKEEKTKKIDSSEFKIQTISPEKEGEYSIKLIYEGNSYSVNEITIREDSTPPAKVTGLTARKEKGKILLAWNPNKEDDLMEYRIYRSKEDNMAYTTYTHAKTVQGNLSGIELEEWKTNYFYVIAVDYFGNESEPSEVIEAR
jgi:hypothetical protein